MEGGIISYTSHELGAVLAFSIIASNNSIMLLPYISIQIFAISSTLLLLLIHTLFAIQFQSFHNYDYYVGIGYLIGAILLFMLFLAINFNTCTSKYSILHGLVLFCYLCYFAIHSILHGLMLFSIYAILLLTKCTKY